MKFQFFAIVILSILDFSLMAMKILPDEDSGYFPIPLDDVYNYNLGIKQNFGAPLGLPCSSSIYSINTVCDSKYICYKNRCVERPEEMPTFCDNQKGIFCPQGYGCFMNFCKPLITSKVGDRCGFHDMDYYLCEKNLTCIDNVCIDTKIRDFYHNKIKNKTLINKFGAKCDFKDRLRCNVYKEDHLICDESIQACVKQLRVRGSPCNINEDCDSNKCIDGLCSSGLIGDTCRDISDCVLKNTCMEGVCRERGSLTQYKRTLGSKCNIFNGCDDPLVCKHGYCVLPCTKYKNKILGYVKNECDVLTKKFHMEYSCRLFDEKSKKTYCYPKNFCTEDSECQDGDGICKEGICVYPCDNDDDCQDDKQTSCTKFDLLKDKKTYCYPNYLLDYPHPYNVSRFFEYCDTGIVLCGEGLFCNDYQCVPKCKKHTDCIKRLKNEVIDERFIRDQIGRGFKITKTFCGRRGHCYYYFYNGKKSYHTAEVPDPIDVPQ